MEKVDEMMRKMWWKYLYELESTTEGIKKEIDRMKVVWDEIGSIISEEINENWKKKEKEWLRLWRERQEKRD